MTEVIGFEDKACLILFHSKKNELYFCGLKTIQVRRPFCI